VRRYVPKNKKQLMDKWLKVQNKRCETRKRRKFQYRCKDQANFWGAKDFCPNSPNLPEKHLCDLCLQFFSYQDYEDIFLVWPPKQGLHVFCVFFCKRWASFLLGFSGIFHWFSMILPDFRQTKIFMSALAPPPPTPLIQYLQPANVASISMSRGGCKL